MTPTSAIDYAVPACFTVPQNGKVGISVNDYTRLIVHSKEYTVGSGKNQWTYAIVHTDIGYISLNLTKSGAQAEWMADHFTITAVYSDEKGNHSFSFDHDGKRSELPFQAIIPANIDTSFYGKGIAINTQNKAHEAFAQYLQGLLHKIEVQDAKQVLGWKQTKEQLMWMGASHDPPLLQIQNTFGSVDAYMRKLNTLIACCFALEFVICGAVASALLAYMRILLKLPVNTFGISMKSPTSKGKTTAEIVALSMFDMPTATTVFSDFYGTENALIYELGRHQGVPLCYDETTMQNGGISKEDFIYTASNGNSKKCLDTKRKPRERDTWLCSALFSSETDLVDYEKCNKGMLVRIINLDGMTYTQNSEHSVELKTFAANNYGIVGDLFAKYLLMADPDEIKELYDEAKAELKAAEGLCKCDLTNRMIENHAIILVTGRILIKLGMEIDIDEIKKISVASMNLAARYADRGKYLIQKIFGYISSNYHRLKDIEWDSDTELEPTSVTIGEHTFEAILKGIGWNEKKDALKEIDTTGCLMRQSEGRYKTRTTRDNVPYYSYRFDMNKAKEQFDGDLKLNYSSIKQRQRWDRYTDNNLTIVDDSEAVINGYNCKINGEGRTFEGKLFFL